MIFYDTVKTFRFSKHQNEVTLVLKLLNSRTWITLKSSVVIFQALETSPTYTFIRTYIFIYFHEHFPPTLSFGPTLVFGTLEYVHRGCNMKIIL